MAEVSVVLEGRGLVESPRWHDGRLWFADWTAGEILNLAADGALTVAARAAAPPLSFDFDPEGRVLVVASGATHLMRQAPDGTLQPFAAFGEAGGWNEIVVDGRGNTYVNGPKLLLIRPDGTVEAQAEDLGFPNGMAVSAEGRTLVCAESWARRLTGFDIADDGRLSGRRVWADLGDSAPDGLCFDEAGAVWYASVPGQHCRRVREGGEVLDEVKLDRGAFACMLGGPDRRTLYITAAQWFGMDRMGEMGGTGQVLAAQVDVAGAGWP
ncbi:MAG TPA: SMP-30/gluconolactonase/LRE family protein [Caulobacteraceae bacterium]|jgi:sugar lactone lactonase YvrE